MIECATFLGISMAPRRNRRRLVVITYGLVAGAVVSASVLLTRTHARIVADVITALQFFLTMLWFIIAYSIFGRIAHPAAVSPWWQRSRIVDRGLGLGATAPPEVPPSDERELALRNTAYYYAYQIFAGACFVGLIAFVVAEPASTEGRQAAHAATIMLLLVLAPTLPQAVILWREHDLSDD